MPDSLPVSAPHLVEAVPVARNDCRVCAGALHLVLDLGSLYVSDFPNSAGTRAHPPVPLVLSRCEHCGLVQLTHTTPREWMYGTYWYRSGVNESMRAELKDVVQSALRYTEVPVGATVVDIGANDGTLLQQYTELGHPKLLKVAWEPATNLYEALRPHAAILYPEFFKVMEAWPASVKARLITSVAMFYDLDDPHTFLEGICQILHPDGVFVIQQAYLLSMLTTTGFDNIVHEHLTYYSLGTLKALLEAHGLEIVDVDLRAINGGSFRVYVKFAGRARVDDKVNMRLQIERLLLSDVTVFEWFADRARAVKDHLHGVLQPYADCGVAVDLYAASTKVNTLLQACGIDARLIRQAWERSPEKLGRYVGVSGIPIVSEAEGRADPPAALLVGAWQWKRNFIERETAYLEAGGRLIIPLPAVEVVEQRRA